MKVSFCCFSYDSFALGLHNFLVFGDLLCVQAGNRAKFSLDEDILTGY